MSYILDALRRSQAERERGLPPSVHTRAEVQPGILVPPPRRNGMWLVLLLLACLAVALGAWRFWRPAAQVLPGATPPASAPSNESRLAQPVAATAPRAPEPLPAQEEPLRPLQPAPQPKLQTRAVRDTAPTRLARTEHVAPARPAPKAPAEPGEKNAADTTAPVFAQADLPPAVQAQLPKLQLAGVTYSENPKFRMVIVNGQVLHEGDLAAPGLQLERIEQGRTLWSFRGYRYALPAQ